LINTESIFIFVKKMIMTVPEIFRKFKRQYFFQHLFFWLISVVLFTVVLVYTRGDISLSTLNLKMAVDILITMAFLAVSVYINLLWLIPGFFHKRKFFLFFILEVANILLFILLNYFVTYFFQGGKHPDFMPEFVAEFILVLIFLIVSTLLKVMRDSITLQDVELKIKEVEKQKIVSELRTLKAQINPHFFFNTLNSIYSLSLDKSEKTPELILKLSDLMRYVIYESNDDLVPMSKQLEFLESYVFLERLRAGDSLKIDFEVKGGNTDLKVAPLIFIAFIENAFKHGSKSKENNPFISISFDLEHTDRVILVIENRVEPVHERPTAGGFGLVNVKKRLELIYPGKHILNIRETETVYRVELTILAA